MRSRLSLCGIGLCLVLASSQGWADEKPPPPQPHATYKDALACAAPAGSDPLASFTPPMLGDSSGISVFNSQAKIAENESPRPLDRAFATFNYFNNLDKSTLITTGSSIHNVAYYRYTLGFEKTFLDQRASIGLRAPINTIDADGRVVSRPRFPSMAAPGAEDTNFGDVSIILKAIIAEERDCWLLSGGLEVTLDTGERHLTNRTGDLLTLGHRGTSLQPFLGFIWTSGDVYVHGFSAIDIPTDRKDAFPWYNDVGIGYVLFRDNEGIMSAVAPTFEVHVTDPLRDRGSRNIGGPDVVDFTLGMTVEIKRSPTLALGLAFPVTGPKPFDIEMLAQFNYRF